MSLVMTLRDVNIVSLNANLLGLVIYCLMLVLFPKGHLGIFLVSFPCAFFYCYYWVGSFLIWGRDL